MKKCCDLPCLTRRRWKKITRVMKLTITLLLFAILTATAGSTYSQSTRINLKMKDASLVDVFREIERTSEFGFFFKSEDLDLNKHVSIDLKNATIDEILEKILIDNYSYRILDKNIIITKSSENTNVNEQQQKSVSGKVTDNSGGSLPGVSVVIKKTTTGTITDSNGKYSLSNVPENATLQFSFVGMKTQEISIGNKSTINVVLEDETIGIEEVVAVGYGTVKKSDLTGSVSSVKADEIKNRAITTVGQALQGKASGVLVKTNSAAPGSKMSINIRGQNSINSDSGPLYVVNGLPMNDISLIPPEDIQSIEVLKDGSSTAIYGSRGANGVILLTTKRGENGKAHVSYNFRTSIERISHKIDLMNAEEFANVYTEWQKALNPNITNGGLWFNGSAPDRPFPNEAGKGTDWFNEITRHGVVNNHRINICGGSSSNTYSVSFHYLDHKGVILGSSFNRLGINLSNQFYISKWINAGLDAFVTNSNKNSSDENTGITNAGAATQSVIHAASKMSPATPIYTEDGAYYPNTLPASVTLENPIASAKEVEDQTNSFTAFGKLYFEFNLLRNIKFKISGGANRSIEKNYFYNPTSTIYGALKGGEAKLGEGSNSYIINENTITYSNVFSKLHKIDVLAGFTYEKEINESTSNTVSGFFTNFYKYNNLQAASTFGTPTSVKTQWQLASFINRINYAFNNKYLFSFTSRYDGSSKFGGDNKWGFFPSIALAWRVSEEAFLKQFEYLSNFKIRASYGITGNSNIGLYQSLPSFSLANYPLGTMINSGVAAAKLENKDLKWETTNTTNLGMDITLVNKINVVFDFYKKETNDLLYSVPLIETSGYSSILRNVGSLENKGFEVSLNAPIINKKFKWEIGGMFSMNRNKITKLTGDASLSWRINNPLGAKRGYRIDGIINDQKELDSYVDKNGKYINNAKLGDWKIIDINGDGKIDSGDMKNEIIFDPNPDFTYSLSNDFIYKNFSLSIFIQGIKGNQILNKNNSYFFTALDQIRSNLSKDVINNYWTPNNSYNIKYARLGSATYSQIYEQNGFAEDGSFLRVQNISLSYQFPLKRISTNLKLYFSAENVLTLTKYTGFDPDISSTTENDDLGIDQNSYPMPRTYTLGIELTF